MLNKEHKLGSWSDQGPGAKLIDPNINFMIVLRLSDSGTLSTTLKYDYV